MNQTEKKRFIKAKKIKIITLLFPVLFAAMIISSCGKSGETKTEPEKKLQAVKIKEIISRPFEEKYKIVGIVKPYDQAKISSEEGGLITYQPFDKGNRVRKGQVVVRLRKDQDEAAYLQAQTQLELAKSNFERTEKLYEEKVATEQDYTNSKFQLELAEKNLDVLDTRLSKSYIVSPISGVIDQKYLGKGEVCGPGTPILNVVDVSRVKISGGVPERFIGEVQKGTEVKIAFAVYPGEEFFGKVNYISPVLSSINRTFDIEIVLNNSDGKFKPEMSAELEIDKTKIESAIVLTQDLIVDFGNEKYVFVLDNDVARKKVVTLGGRDNNEVLITSGLNENDKLIYEGYQSLADGDKVQVIN